MLHTIQIANIKSLPPGTQVIDITVKSSKPPWNIFAPTWEMVGDYKIGRLSENEYTEKYMDLIRSRYRANKRVFRQLIQMALDGDVALACYCDPSQFCHRHLLVAILLTIEPRLKYVKEPIPQKIEQAILF